MKAKIEIPEHPIEGKHIVAQSINKPDNLYYLAFPDRNKVGKYKAIQILIDNNNIIISIIDWGETSITDETIYKILPKGTKLILEV